HHQQRAHRERLREVDVELRVDRERQRLRHALQAAREHDRRPELADPARERERRAGAEPAGGERERDSQERTAGACAEGTGGRQQRRVDRLEGGDRRTQVERPGDERHREHDRRLREADLQAERVERPAEQSQPAERGEQADARDRRREDERELAERDDQGAAAKPAGREQVRGGRADQKRERERDPVRLRGHRERVEDDAVVEPREQLAGGDTDEDRQHRQREKRQRERRRRTGEGGEGCASQVSIITEVAFTTAAALFPGRRPSSSAASRVMIATTRDGSVTSSSTWASRPSTRTSRTTPRKWLRALICSPAPPFSRAISVAGTSRRLAASRWVRMRPARSQRRSVSRLIPSARAASAAVYVLRLGIA